MKFIDLFAGLGGFHLALGKLGHKCVFACEIDEGLRQIYELNFGLKPAGDIRSVKLGEIPAHDVLCAGFPCQPFSKAGEQQGFDCPKWGDLFEYVTRIIKHHKPSFLLLENVPNLKRHNNGGTWQDLVGRLEELGYSVDAERLSPHHFGIPQIRERIFIVGAKKGLHEFKWPERSPAPGQTIADVLEEHPQGAKKLSPQVRACLDVWQEFIKAMPANVEFPACPLWSMEFGATYPYLDQTPWGSRERLGKSRGSHGKRLKGLTGEELWSSLPSYARAKRKRFPAWKRRFIEQNREFYRANRKWIDRWLPKILKFPPSLQKLEWNCKGETRDIWRYLIQFRASGVRVKRPTTAPSLVAMTTTQIPIVGWEKRYMTPRECAKLQSMGGLKHLPKSEEATYSALGNAVNARVARKVAENLLGHTPAAKKRSKRAATIRKRAA